MSKPNVLVERLLQVSHLDAALGGSEERMKRTNGTLNERQSVTDNVMRQEQRQNSRLCQETGRCGVGAADD